MGNCYNSNKTPMNIVRCGCQNDSCCPQISIYGCSGGTGSGINTGLFLNLDSTAPIIVAESNVVPFSEVNVGNADVIYDAVSDSLTFINSGTYYINYSVLVTAEAPTTNIILSLENSAGTVYAVTGNTIASSDLPTQISGQAIVTVPAGANLRIVNRSDGTITLETLTGSNGTAYSANFSIIRLS